MISQMIATEALPRACQPPISRLIRTIRVRHASLQIILSQSLLGGGAPSGPKVSAPTSDQPAGLRSPLCTNGSLNIISLSLVVDEWLPRSATTSQHQWFVPFHPASPVVVHAGTYCENSPSLWPTISSVMVTWLYTLPLYTSKFMPTKLGSIVADRAWVRMGGVYLPGWGLTRGRLVFWS